MDVIVVVVVVVDNAGSYIVAGGGMHKMGRKKKEPRLFYSREKERCYETAKRERKTRSLL